MASGYVRGRCVVRRHERRLLDECVLVSLDLVIEETLEGPLVADTNVKKLLAVLVSGATDVEAVLQQLLTQRNIGTAIGAQLDRLARIVGQERLTTDDDVHRRYVRARIATQVEGRSGICFDRLKSDPIRLGCSDRSHERRSGDYSNVR